MTDNSELLAATDEAVDDAVKYADPMVLRGRVSADQHREHRSHSGHNGVYQRFQARQCLKGPRSASIQG
jgi:hypothetical protein